MSNPLQPPSPAALAQLRDLLGPQGFVEDPEVLAPLLVEPRRRYRGNTPALLRPASSGEVAQIVRICAEARIGLVPQGGNTGLVAGQTPRPAGNDLLVSLSRMNHVRNTDAAANTITVEAGCTLAAVQQAASDVDRLFPLSLASEGTCQIGGNLSTNAGGIHVLRYGNARDLVLGLEVVTADGQIWDGLRGLRKDNTGYDLKHLFMGAEGTLGIITAAVLKLFPQHRHLETIFAAVPSLESAVTLLGALRAATDDALLAFEVIPRLGLEIVLRHMPGSRDPLPVSAPWYVLADLTVSRAVAEAALTEAVEHGLIADAVLADSPAQGKALWRLRESLSEAQGREGGSIKHDVSVPIARIPAFVEDVIAAVARIVPGIRPVPFGHLGDGNLHFNFSQPIGVARDVFLAQWEQVNGVVHDLVAAHGGSISAEHGIGQSKRGEIQRYKNATEIDLMQRIKKSLDPLGIMNPEKGVV
ncbi:MAG: FAD-binding oxidoreductase [Deltaproteobacteria bacterium]|nr:FAD-binding oxidoreductase [Deltaproteobacteria bacterium]